MPVLVCMLGTINPLRAYSARVTVVGLSVCVSMLIPALQPTKRPTRDTSDFRTT